MENVMIMYGIIKHGIKVYGVIKHGKSCMVNGAWYDDLWCNGAKYNGV